MAGEPKTYAAAVSAEDDDAKYGFERSEMYQTNLAGTVDYFERHVFLCYKSHDSWPSKVEDSDSDPLPKNFASALKARRSDIKIKTRLTICEAAYDMNLSDGDVLIFPQMIVYRGLTESDFDNFVEDVLVSGKPWVSGVQEELNGSFVFVCAHNNRDRRCGVCGPPLIEKFKEEIASKNLSDPVFVAACSHIGGHKYAGNVIIFSADSDGKVAGNWYGYVTPSDVLELIDTQIGNGEVIERIWRGQMGVAVKEAEKVEEPKVANGTSTNNHEQQPQEVATGETTKNVGGCCQGANGFSCCMNEVVERKTDNKEAQGLSAWTGKWEQRHVLTTVAVVGAVATIAVAYGVYRRAR
ncbi:altered inheritance of mitochondria protein 32-like [Salvia divinorum]|uniref:Altered inheritance of mitochondria protein 32-like n=1 Tax=Salvia divinorum TaxID=28513 RepID=A0ABD1HE37_SALDI